MKITRLFLKKIILEEIANEQEIQPITDVDSLDDKSKYWILAILYNPKTDMDFPIMSLRTRDEILDFIDSYETIQSIYIYPGTSKGGTAMQNKKKELFPPIEYEDEDTEEDSN